MNPRPPERRFDELFVRYWDSSLTDSEADELAVLLATDPLARDWFRMNTLHAVASADLPVAIAPTQSIHRGWSRRRVLHFLGGGMAVGVAAAVIGRKFVANPDRSAVEIASAKGGVTVTTLAGKPLPPVGPLPRDVIVSTHGTGSTAILTFPNGSDVMLAGDTSITLKKDNRQLHVARGSAVADIRPARAGEQPLSFLTPEVVVSTLGGVLLTLTHLSRSTEIGVQVGQVAVAAPSGEPIANVRDGELFTVRAGGSHTKQALHATGENYTLDLTQPLPDGWFVGRRVELVDGAVLRPELWFDPYHQAEMYQVRSHSRWANGLFRLQPDSEITVRYRTMMTGKGQVSLVSRTENLKVPATGVLEWNGVFESGGWRTLTVRAGDLLDNREAPKFGPPWVAFLIIFNTYGTDLGLEVAEFRVSRPGGRFAG